MAITTIRGRSAGGPPARGALYLLCLTILISAVAFSFRFQSFLHAKELVAAVAIPGIIALAWRSLTVATALRAFLPLWLYVALALLIHGALGAARLPEEAVEQCLRMILMLAAAALFVAFVVDAHSRRLLENAFIVSAVAVGGLSILQYFGLTFGMFPVMPGFNQRAYSVFGNQNLLGGYMALAVAAILAPAAAVRGFSTWALAALAVSVSALVISGSRTAWLAAAAGAMIAVAHGRPNRRFFVTTLVVIGAAVFVTAALAPEASIARFARVFSAEDEGAWIRLWIWDGAWRIIRDHAWIGVGPGNFAYWTPLYQGEAFFAHEEFIHHHNEIHTLHAHSEPLEILAETGVLGAALVAWLLVSLRRYRGPGWAPLGTFGVFALCNTVSHSMPHMLWFFFIAAVMLRAAPQDPRPRRAAPWLLLVGATLCSVMLVWTVYLPSYLLRRAEASRFAPALYERALDHPWPDAEAHYRYGMALLGEGDDNAAYYHLQRARRGNDTGGLHLALAVLEYQRGELEAALHHVRECRYRWPSNLDAFRLHVRLPYRADSEIGHPQLFRQGR